MGEPQTVREEMIRRAEEIHNKIRVVRAELTPLEAQVTEREAEIARLNTLAAEYASIITAQGQTQGEQQ